MYRLPTTITIRDNEFKIRDNGDFRVILDCFEAVQDEELTDEERVISSLIIFYGDIQCLDDVPILFYDQDMLSEAVEKMFDFFNCGQKAIGSKQNYKLIDWRTDEQIVCAGINNVANTEIRALPYLHWYTFMGYYTSIGESVLSTVVSIRHKIATGKKLEKYEKDFKRENPEYFSFDYRTADQKSEDLKIREMFNTHRKGGV